jgi:glycosyltransferase involved in cell wall biosynthesis
LNSESTSGGKRLALLLPDMRGGGAERVALRLIEDFLAAGHQVDLVLLKPEGELLPLVPRAVTIVSLDASRIRSAVRPLVRYFKSRTPHAIQISMWPLTVAGLLAHRISRSRARVVVSDHIALSKQYSSRAVGITARLAYPLADARVLVSNNAADDLARISGLDRASIEVIYNPVDKPPPGSAPTEDLEALWGGGPRIITVGSFKEQKNHAMLIRSFAALLRRRPAKLMILGDGPLRPQLEALARSMGVAEHVLMPGFRLDPWPLYSSADVFALSSDYEGYPLVLIEALRSGLPVVSTDCETGPREILEDGRYGRLVPVGDEAAFAEALEEALSKPVDNAAQVRRAEELSGPATSKRYLDLMLGADRVTVLTDLQV